MVRVVINPVGFLLLVLAGVVYYQIFEASSVWLLLSCIGVHFLLTKFVKVTVERHAGNTIRTLATECEKLAKYVKVLARENKELSRRLDVKDTHAG
jgi:hypothetical protein